MTHDERRRLIEAPISFVVHPKRTWGGVLIRQTVPTDGHRTFEPAPEDEELLGSTYLDDELRELHDSVIGDGIPEGSPLYDPS